MKLLTICIPTYNRSKYLISLLDFLKSEIFPYRDLIEVRVSDNCSDESHKSETKEYYNRNPFFEITYNEENLGLIGNIYYLLKLTNSSYIWFVGDDDVLLEGVVHNVIDILSDKTNSYYIFLNNSSFKNDFQIVGSPTNLMSYSKSVKNGKKCIMDLFRMNGSVNMFISSCVFSVSTLEEFLKVDRHKLIIDPLLFSFYAATVDTVYIENEVFVLDRVSEVSWENERKAVSYWLIPIGIIELNRFNYSNSDINLLLHGYFEKYNFYYLRMILFAPIIFKKDIVCFLGFRQISLFFSSLGSNIKLLFIKIFISKR